MELRHLRYFVAIAEERSFTRAAERLWVAQPGLSTQIRRLEAELGVQLFERHTRGVDVTAAGELFLERARLTLAAADAAGATGRDLQAGASGTLRLGIATEARCRQAPLLLQRFASERAGVELTVLEAYGGTLWRDLREGRLDGLLAPTGFGAVDLRSLQLGVEPWMLLVGTGHRLAGVDPLAAEELDGERIMVSGHRDGAGYDRAIEQLLDDLDIAAVLVPGAPGPALQAAIAEGALALTTAPLLFGAGVTARPLEPTRVLGFELLWRDETPSPALDAFIQTASSCVEAGATGTARHLAAAA
jgi:DNA-binding transcriptional LysR family regulator